MKIGPRGVLANRLRREKGHRRVNLSIPPDGLPGSLALTHRRCSKATCHCTEGKDHPVWSLTFMLNGKKRVERVSIHAGPATWFHQGTTPVDHPKVDQTLCSSAPNTVSTHPNTQAGCLTVFGGAFPFPFPLNRPREALGELNQHRDDAFE